MDGPQGAAASSSSPGWVKPETGTAGSGAPSPQQQPPQQQQHSAGSQQGHGLAPDIFSLDFDDLVFGSGLALDVPTLNAVCAIEGGCNGKGSSSRHRQRSNKRAEPEPGSSDSDDDDDDDGGTAGGGAGLKRSKSELSQAATRKASREKARRTKLNERFADLAKLIDPGNEPKTDKTTILSDAVRYVQQLHVENHQLKQLNKFLEERVAQYERDRGQQLYQQSLMMQQQQQGMMGGPPGMMQQGMMGGPGPSMMQHPPLLSAGLGMHLAGSSSMGAGVGMHPLGSGSSLGMPVHSLGQQQQQQQQSQSGSQAGPSSGPLGGGMAMQSHHGLHTLPVPGSLPPGLQTQPPQQQQQSIGHGGGSGSLEAKPMVLGHMAQPVAPGGYWLPNTMHDSTQDSLLRPPAA